MTIQQFAADLDSNYEGLGNESAPVEFSSYWTESRGMCHLYENGKKVKSVSPEEYENITARAIEKMKSV